jgi:peptidoglycan/LPS O-acetylase OafA/YrhL
VRPSLAGTGRQSGLDTLRALAITLVFVYHYRIFVSPQPDLGWLSNVGWVGVDLFFVLSGYLITDQVMGAWQRGQTLSIPVFWARRALRTWPAFWVVLAAYFIWPEALGGRAPPPLWRFLSFTQNWGLLPGTAFSHAWSLCIEEQFYLVLPLVLWAAHRWGTRWWQAWALLAGLTALGVGLRASLWQRYGPEGSDPATGYMPHIYYATLCRFDEFLPGVAVALLRHGHPALWQRVQAHGQALLAVALAATAALLWGAHRWYTIDGQGYGAFMTVLGYSLLAWAFAGLVAAALCPGNALHRWRVPGAYPLALWSYSIYLSHKAVGHLARTHLGGLGWHPWLLWCVVVLASLTVGVLLHHAVEQPFMRLRARWF